MTDAAAAGAAAGEARAGAGVARPAPFGIYVHVPFCASKCRYCSFVSRPAAAGEIPRYLGALHREIAGAAERGREASTVYLGGGTPSLLGGPEVRSLLAAVSAAFPLAEGAEVTIEANPGTLTARKLGDYREAGVNRVSLGVQSFDDRALGRLGRRHGAADALAAWRLLRGAGFSNLGLDLMHSLPGQRPAGWRRDLERALALEPDHLSLYGLCVEEGTPLAEAHRAGILELPGESEQLEMLALARELTDAAGLEWYEVSNYARPGRACRHNLDCWGLGEYRGFGAAAHSFRRRPSPERHSNTDDVAAYVAAVESGAAATALRDRLSDRQLAGEGLMLGLRTRAGVDEGAFLREHGAAPGDLFGSAVSRGLERGWLERGGGNRLRLTPAGVLLSDALFRDLF